MNDGNTGMNLSGLLLKLFVFLVSIPALLSCGMFAGDPSPTSTPAPVMVSANVLTPVATGEAPGADDRPDEELSVPTPEPTLTPEPTYTPEPTPTPQPSPTPEPTVTVTPDPTATPNPTATPEPTSTPDPTATPNPTATPEPTSTPDPTSTPEPTATVTPDPTSTPNPTATPEPTSTPDPTATPNPTATPAQLPRGSDALLEAIHNRDAEAVKTLVEADFPVNVSDEEGNPFLYTAIEEGIDAYFAEEIENMKRHRADSRRCGRGR